MHIATTKEGDNPRHSRHVPDTKRVQDGYLTPRTSGWHVTAMKKMRPCNPRTSGRGTMASNDEAASRATGDWPQVRSGPLMTGGILIGIGAAIALAGNSMR